jgi:hypothetical protein
MIPPSVAVLLAVVAETTKDYGFFCFTETCILEFSDSVVVHITACRLD